MHELEAEVGRDLVDTRPADRTGGVLDRGQQIVGDLFDLRKVVVLATHPFAQVGVGAAGVLGGGGLVGLRLAQRSVHADQCLERLRRKPRPWPNHWDAKGLERIRPLRLLQFDLQRRAPAGRLSGQYIRQVRVQGGSKRGQQ